MGMISIFLQFDQIFHLEFLLIITIFIYHFEPVEKVSITSWVNFIYPFF
jgi:hypothetical protein